VEGSSVGPLGQQCADEALRLPVGLGSIGPRAARADGQLGAGRPEGQAAVGVAVVGQQPLDGDAVAGVEGHRSAQEADGGGRRLVGQLLDVGQAAVVVDRDVDPVPTQTTVPIADLTAVDAVPATGGNPPQALGVEVDQLAGCGALVAHNRRARLKPVEPAQPLAAQHGVDRRATQTGPPRQAVGTDPQLVAQPAQVVNDGRIERSSLAMDAAAAVEQALLALAPVAVPPLRAGLAADARRGRRSAHRPTAGDAFDQDQPTTRREPRVSMRHEGPSFDCGLLTNSRRIRALTRQQPD
jgi:hypothetical protein